MNNIENITQKIIQHVEQGQELMPILFIGNDDIKIKQGINKILTELGRYFGQDYLNNYFLETEEKSLKLKEIKEFLSPSNEKPRDRFQSFTISDLDKMTVSAANASLKIFEEPIAGNIFFLSAKSTGNILDTVLSRVQIVQVLGEEIRSIDPELSTLLENYITDGKLKILPYIYNQKLTPESGVIILNTVLETCKKNNRYFEILQEVVELKQLMIRGTIQPKYAIDKVILSM